MRDMTEPIMTEPAFPTEPASPTKADSASRAESPTGVAVVVADYDPAWPGMAAAAIDELHGILPGVLTEIEHIGSTSVPGLAAKPIIDVMAAVDDLESVSAHAATLAAHGYEAHDNGIPGRLLFMRMRDGVRTTILHVVTLDTWPTRNQRILRDHLRTHPADAARYGRLKQDVAASGLTTLEYTKAKTDLIQELTDRARADRGLPSVPVWEKASR